MGHHHHHNNHEDNASKNIFVAFWLNAVFVVIEVIGGFFTNSIAILSDALHDLGDCVSLGLAWWLQRKSKQQGNAVFSYGYKRFSLLGAMFLSTILVVSSCFMLYEAVLRLIHPAEVNATGMLWLAIVGIIINGSAAFNLQRGHSLNERAAFFHIMEDVLGWAAVLIVSIVLMFKPWTILDPLMSIGINLWILWNAAHNLIDTFRVFLQATPEGLDLDTLRSEIMNIEDIEDVHDLHIWTQDGETHVMTLHIVTSSNNLSALKHKICHLAEGYHIEHVTIETESPDEHCNRKCN
ncbi:MAG: cation diffusion facilitator family transporter [Bacteroidales bacterium]|nr:cation diffusion facilitator family transporter [Bacteroidales bacterium]